VGDLLEPAVDVEPVYHDGVPDAPDLLGAMRHREHVDRPSPLLHAHVPISRPGPQREVGIVNWEDEVSRLDRKPAPAARSLELALPSLPEPEPPGDE
jgi:hypothetical protein